MDVGANIASYRQAAGLSQRSLASRIGVTRQTISSWETGRTLPDADSVARLAETFGITADELLSSEDARDRIGAIEARHAIVANATGYALCMGAYILISVVEWYTALAVRRGALDSSWEGIDRACSLLALVVLLWGLRYSMRVERIVRDLGLAGPLEVAAFMEGRGRRGELPRDLMYRVVIPHWRWISLGFLAVFAAVLLMPLLLY